MSTRHVEPSHDVVHGRDAHPSQSEASRGEPDVREAGGGDASPTSATTTPQAELHDTGPTVTSHQLRRMNRNALTLLASIVLLLSFVAFWLFHSAGVRQERAETPTEETVSVPEAPVEPLPPPPEQERPPIELVSGPLSPPSTPTGSAYPSAPGTASVEPRKPTLLERRIAAAEAGVAGASAATSVDAALQAGYMLPPTSSGAGATGGATEGTASSGNRAYSAATLPEVSRATPLRHPDRLMRRGTYIRCVLESRIITDMPGFTSCIVSEPIYSFTGKKLLLPKGSKIMGRYDMEPNGPRVAVIWDRIVTPNGIDVNMASPGVDTLGGSGHPGRYTAHWGSRIGAALLISIFSDAFKYSAARHGPRQTTITNGVVTQSPYESNTAETLQRLANEAVSRQANRPATVTIHQGTILSIHVAKDVDFTEVLAH